MCDNINWNKKNQVEQGFTYIIVFYSPIKIVFKNQCQNGHSRISNT